MKPIVSLHNTTKTYPLGKVLVPALRGVTLEICAGDFLSIVGPSGSGKTTILNLIGCVDTPTSGRVEVAGHDISRLTERQLTDLRLHTIGFVFQSFNLVNVLDVFRNVELPLLLQRQRSSAVRRKRVLEMLERVGLADFTRHRPGELSGGQRQRVAIARALVTEPCVVLADEPTANLDSTNGESILRLMRELNQERTTTFVFSTHDPRVLAYASRVVRIADGLMADAHVTPQASTLTDASSADRSYQQPA